MKAVTEATVPPQGLAPAAAGGQDHSNPSTADHKYQVTVLFDGADSAEEFPVNMKVREAILKCLPPKDKPNVADFEMVDANIGTQPLNADLTLLQAGVRDGHVLSITKKHGGGG